MTESGRSCRKTTRNRDDSADRPFDVELDHDEVRIRFRGQVVRTLTGPDAAHVRAVIDDPERLERVVARMASTFKRSGDR